mmetsp:Transcript_79524/g.208848  ORF Transcript_79524/g.208848 Transcript_79524/m.208848 type:complete len:99 (-) Transcript_79524:56-352(-)
MPPAGAARAAAEEDDPHGRVRAGEARTKRNAPLSRDQVESIKKDEWLTVDPAVARADRSASAASSGEVSAGGGGGGGGWDNIVQTVLSCACLNRRSLT